METSAEVRGKLEADARRPTLRLFCDFDGTIVPEDVGDAFFESFGDGRVAADRALFLNGDIDSREVFRRYCRSLRDVTPAAVDQFCKRFAVDQTFPPFVQWARERSYPLTILSDGMDVYIERILRGAGLGIPAETNAFQIVPDGTYRIELPYADAECRRCGMCKRDRMMLASADDDVIVLIGDGVSDFCAASYADLVFAKGELEKYCQRENITFRSFRSFSEIRETLDRMRGTRALRVARRAALRRSAVWARG